MIRISVKYLFLSVLMLFFVHAQGQNTSVNGKFNSHYFSVDDFGSAAQIWAGEQGSDGNVYFGNKQDLLVYNGIEWKKIKTDISKTDLKKANAVKETAVHELFRASDNILYVARENNFGYVAYSDSGAPRYFPIYSCTDSKSSGDFWNIYELNNQKILFVAEKELYTVKNKKATKLELPSSFNGYFTKTSSRFGSGILIVYQKIITNQERKFKHLYVDLISGKMKELTLPEHIDLRNVRGSFEINQTWYLLDIKGQFYSATQENGTFNWNSKEAVIFPEMQGLSPNYIRKNGNHIYMGTQTEGVVIADLTGKVVRRIDFYDGLENLSIFKLFHDNEGNLWLCLDNGIQLIETSSPITYFTKSEGVTSLPEAIVFNEGKMLVGFHSDIFRPEVTNTHKFFVSNNTIKQDVFDLATFTTSQGNKTLVIGYDGLYEYNPKTNKSSTISPNYAFSLYQDKSTPDIIYVALEAGIGKITLQKNGTWKYEDLWNDVGGETFNLVVTKGKVYFGINGKGIAIYDLRTKKHQIVREKSKKPGDVSSYYVELFQGEIFVETTKGICTLSRDEKQLNLLPRNDDFFGNSKNDFHRIININDEQLWIVIYRDLGDGKFEILTGWLEKHGKNNWKWIKWPLAGLQKSGIISSIVQGPDNEIWLGASNGLYVVNFDAIRKYRQKVMVSIDRFEAGGKIIRYNVFKATPIDALSYSQNSFRITFHSNSFSGKEHTKYRYQLVGFNDDWSDWSDQYYANFQKIGEGDYTLKIQAKNGFGIESEVLEYKITILPPWYRTIWAFVLYIIGLIFVIFGIVQLSTQRVKRQNQRLEATVVERTSEIAEQNKQLEQQKSEITQKTTDILDSIQYAKRIQTTILPADSRLKELFHEHFVFYRPKDIVSGDFYWIREVQGKTIFSAVDCTGHGVPGSLVSIVGNNGLLRAVNEFKLTEPHQILDKLREIVVSAFRSEGQQDVKDGMDIALCSIDYETGILKYAGANNECVIIRGKEVFELKPDKQPIGQFVDAKPFNQQEFQLEEDDCIYLYTDGYVDQFGGEKAKKFKSRPFKNMLTELTHLTMQEQFIAIHTAFDNWMGDLDQIDDVCVFGVRYKKK